MEGATFVSDVSDVPGGGGKGAATFVSDVSGGGGKGGTNMSSPTCGECGAMFFLTCGECGAMFFLATSSPT